LIFTYLRKVGLWLATKMALLRVATLCLKCTQAKKNATKSATGLVPARVRIETVYAENCDLADARKQGPERGFFQE
jgi:hypothetical protein